MRSSAIERWLHRFEQLPETLSHESMGERPVLAWSVQAIIISKKFTVKKQPKNKVSSASGLFHSDGESEGRIVVYRGYFVRLLTVHKVCLRDQLLIELPILEGLRTGEVSSLRAEYVDVERGDLLVMDSKKHQLAVIPLDPVEAEHLSAYMAERGLSFGFLFPPRRLRKPNQKPKRGAAMTVGAIQHIWDKYCRAAGIPVMSPRMGRAYFAAKWVWQDEKDIYSLMAVLRHQDILATQKYLAKIIDYDTVKAKFNQGKKSPFSLTCNRSDFCPLSAENCYCRMFQPQTQIKVQKS
jgi:hypothetical protein